jgi:hypothetical protein
MNVGMETRDCGPTPEANSKLLYLVALYSDFTATMLAGPFRPFRVVPSLADVGRTLHHPRLIGGVGDQNFGSRNGAADRSLERGRVRSSNGKGWPRCSVLETDHRPMDVIAFSFSTGSDGWLVTPT